MPTSFKRREPRRHLQTSEHDDQKNRKDAQGRYEDNSFSNLSAQDVEVHTRGLRSAPFPSLSPLFSSGLASFDDLINGSGIPSSSLLTLCPAIGLTSLSVEAGLASVQSLNGDQARKATGAGYRDSSAKNKEQLRSAQTALDTLMSFGIAQGVIAGHDSVVVAQDVRQILADGLPKYTSRRYPSKDDPGGSKSRKPATQSDRTISSETELLDNAEMKIAFRYAHRPVFKTTVAEPSMVGEQSTSGIPDEHIFRAPLDLSLRWTSDELKDAEEAFARNEGGLFLIETATYQTVYKKICAVVDKAQREYFQRPLRIHLFDLGGQGWTQGAVHDSMEARIVAMSQFLVRIRALLKRLPLPDKSSGRHAICTCVLSSQLLLSSFRTILTHHLLRMSDVEVILSDFTSDERLSRAYSDYAGSVSLLKGPSIGAGLAPGEYRSILRGGIGESGAENDVGWRWKKRGRGIVFETLHEDFDAGNADQNGKEKEGGAVKGGNDIEETALSILRKQNHVHDYRKASAALKTTNEVSIKTRSFKGLASLRERGLEATKLRRQQEQSDQHQKDGLTKICD